MANFIAQSNLGPEYLEATSKALLSSTVNFIGTLTSGGPITVNITNEDNTVVYGTFLLDTLNQRISTGLLFNLAPRIKYNVISGLGSFNIQLSSGV